MPFLSALEVCSRRGTIQIHVYLYLYLYLPVFCIRLDDTALTCAGVADIALVLDSTVISKSHRSSSDWNSALNFIVNIVNSFSVSPNRTKFGAVMFSESVEIAFYFGAYSRKFNLLEAVRDLARKNIGTGGSNLAAALRTTRMNLFSSQNGARPGISRIVLLVTDGQPTVETQMTIPEAALLKDNGIEIFTVGVTGDIDPELL